MTLRPKNAHAYNKPFLIYLFLVILLCFIVQYSIYTLTYQYRAKIYESLFYFNDSAIRSLQIEYLKPKSLHLQNSSLKESQELIGNSTPLSLNKSVVHFLNNFTTLLIEETKLNLTKSRYSTSASKASLCPPIPPDIVGPIKVKLEVLSFEDLEKAHPELSLGGRYQPSSCNSQFKVAVIIPYRSRSDHLRIFLHNIHPFLQKQQINYGIYVIEQADHYRFNRAKLFNVGFKEALKQYDWQCFIFHDVDLLPEDERNLYTCPEQPRHMSVAVNIFKYKLPYVDLFGGVSAVNAKQYELLNGFSNRFWGWGGEDDDMSNRIKYHGLHISRYPPNVARYRMISHKKDPPNPRRYDILTNGKKRFVSDGLQDLKYVVKDILLKRLYTWVYVDLVGP